MPSCTARNLVTIPRAFALAPLAIALACAGTPAPRTSHAMPVRREGATGGDAQSLHVTAARHAKAMIGAPDRFGGRTPRGFDCSGLVVYSYGEAGLPGLPHSAAALERHARPVPLERLRPGDLLLFDLGDRKATHVAIYLGEDAFVHAPSSGKAVERVAFDHAYWGERIRRAGRISESRVPVGAARRR